MALFQKKPDAGLANSFFTLGLNKTVLLVGLGNPGKEYEMTRHNIGFITLDSFVDKNPEMQDWINKKDLKCHLSSGQFGDTKVIAIKPQTFMNLSGEAVQAVAHFYKISPDKIVAIYDELDVDYGTIRMRTGGSSAGHNGVKSITQHIGETYGRIRIGIGPKKPARIKSEDFVLQKFREDEVSLLSDISKEVSAILTEYIYGGSIVPETRRVTDLV